ncbi:MAG: hypothetical protein JJT88_12525 [Gammaproteobacteria bacterium]|nr:hypothetical protein [Gammaproteobacteria bacterium]
MKLASYALNQPGSVQFAICADECLLHFTEEQLTPKQRADHESNKDLIAFLQVASIAMSKPGDRVALYDRFAEEPWRSALERYLALYAKLGLTTVRFEDLQFHPRDDFYQPLVETPPPADLVSVFLLSGTNEHLRADPAAAEVSRVVNSKMSLARDARKFGIPVPESMVLARGDIEGEEARAFLARHGQHVMLKVMGLSGSRNVTAIRSVEEGAAYLAEYQQDVDILLQQRLPDGGFTEMTVDLRIDLERVAITNVRQILFLNGLWIGNFISDTLKLTAEQQAALIRVGEYVRSKGYVAPEGLNCGIDFFVGDDAAEEPIFIIEINARWTGGLMPAELVKRLGAGSPGAVAVVDTVSVSRFADYLAFLEANLYDRGRPFSMAPVGFSPYGPEVDGDQRVYVWHLVFGDLAAFRAAKDAALGPEQLAATASVVLPSYLQ